MILLNSSGSDEKKTAGTFRRFFILNHEKPISSQVQVQQLLV